MPIGNGTLLDSRGLALKRDRRLVRQHVHGSKRIDDSRKCERQSKQNLTTFAEKPLRYGIAI